jgi:zinc transport system permease protein
MNKSDVIISVCVCIPVLVLFVIFYNRIFSVTFDESFARSSGVSAGLFNALIAILTSVTVVLGMRLMGALLISSLVIFPCLTSMRVCKSFKGVTVCSAVISVVCFFLGMYLSVLFGLPTGASIVGMNAVMFVLFSFAGKIKRF